MKSLTNGRDSTIAATAENKTTYIALNLNGLQFVQAIGKDRTGRTRVCLALRRNTNARVAENPSQTPLLGFCWVF